MANSNDRLLYVFRMRGADLFVAACVLAFLLAGSFIMRVYYRITVYEIEVVEVAADGSRTPLATPESIARLRLWHLSAPELLDALDSQLRLLQRDEPWRQAILNGSHFEWTVRYSFNSPHLDQRRVFVYPGAAVETR
jgi:hypothetical protein